MKTLVNSFTKIKTTMLDITIPLFDLVKKPSLTFFKLEKAALLTVNESKRKDLIKKIFPNIDDSKFVIDVDSRDGEEPRRTLDRVLTIFKLFKDEAINSNIVLTDNGEDFLPHYTRWTTADSRLIQYRLNADEEESFQVFWKKHIDIPLDSFAISRFHLADFRPYAKDKLVDYVLSLESLLAPNSQEGEIAYRFRIQGSLVLGVKKENSERKKIKETLKDLYTLRSAIVHGNEKAEKNILGKYANSTQKSDTDPIVGWTIIINHARKLARESILFFLDQNCFEDKDSKKRSALLEDLLIGGSQCSNCNGESKKEE